MTNLPTRRQRRDLSTSLTHLGQQRPPSISIANDRFTKIDANGQQIGEQTLFLDVVICDVAENRGKLYYGHPFGSGRPPKCYSEDGQYPSAQATEPQAPSCGQCWWNVKGSTISPMTGDAAKACRDQQKLAVFCMNGEELDQPPLAYELVVPPASLTNLRQYRDHLATMPPAVAGRKHAGVDDVITRLTIETGKKIGFKAVAQAAGDDEIEDRFEMLTANGATDKLVGRGDQPLPAGAPTAGMLVEGQGQPLQIGQHHPPLGQYQGQLQPPVAPQAPAPAPQVPFAAPAATVSDTSLPPANGGANAVAPSKRGRPKAQEVLLPTGTVAPFTPPAFLQQQGQAAPAQAAFGAAPPPPAAIAEGLAKAMSLPTRRKAE